MTRIIDNAVVNNDNAVNNAKIKINAIERYVPLYTPSLEQHNILMNQIMTMTPTEIHYPERSVFLKEVKTQNLWSFELGTQEGCNVPVWICVVFQQNDRQHDQNLNNDTFYRTPVTSCQCIIGTKNYPDSVTLLKYNNDFYSQGCAQNKEILKLLQKIIYSNHIYQNLNLDV